MNITMITDLYPIKENEHSTPKTLYDFVQTWKELGHCTSVIKPNFILNSFIRQKPFYKQGQYKNILNLNFWLPFINCKKPKDLSSENIYIAHMPSGILYANSINVDFVAGIHQSDIDVLTKPLYRWYFGKRLLKALKKAKAIACRSQILAKKLLALYPEFSNKTFTCQSGINEDIIQDFQNSRDLNFNKRTIKIITVANLKKRKNVDKVIDAIKDLTGFELTIIGNGKEFKKLKKLAMNHHNIKFLGALSNNQVLEKMKDSDIFILPSINETFGMVYLEAMASGCLTIGTINDGIDGIIINGENGYLTTPESKEIKKLLTKIKTLDENTLKSIYKNSHDTICKYTKRKMGEQYLQQILSFCNDLTT